MKYNLIIIRFKNDFTKKLVARQLASNPAISLQKALEIVEHPPFVFQKNLSTADLKRVCTQQKQYGTQLQIEECNEEKDQSLVIPLTSLNSTSNVTNFNKSTPETKTHRPSQKNLTNVSLAELETKTRHQSTLLQKRFFLFICSAISLGLLLWCYHHFPRSHFHLTKYTNPIKQGQDQEFLPPSTDRNIKQEIPHQQNKRFSVTAGQKAKSMLYLDSASSSSTVSLQKKITFYKIALSCNKYNFAAWQGLLATYNKAGMVSKKQETATKMLDLFGPAIFSLLTQVSTLGVIEDASLTSDKTYRILYTTKTTSKQALVAETYQLLKTIKATCACEHISLFASYKKGKGVYVYLDTHKPLISLQDYSQTAQITFFD